MLCGILMCCVGWLSPVVTVYVPTYQVLPRPLDVRHGTSYEVTPEAFDSLLGGSE